MKKKYEAPEVGIEEVELKQHFLAGSGGGWTEGEGGSEGSTTEPGWGDPL